MELKEAHELALKLMHKHNIINGGWNFKFDDARRRFGCCNYRYKTISLSKHLVLLNDVEKVKDTILHEIAHALTPGQKHNWKWRSVALSIGCNGERCYSSNDVTTPEYRYVGECHNCGAKINKMKMPKGRRSCKNCSGGSFNPNFIINFVKNPNF